MSDPGLGPREYAVGPEKAPFAKRRDVRIGAGVLLVLAVGGGAFGIAQAFSGSNPAAATPSAAGSSGTLPPSGSSGTRPSGGDGSFSQNGTLRGEITKVSSSSFTIATRAGGSETVTVNAKTGYRSATGGTESFSDLKANEVVIVTVEPNVTPYVAETVTIEPAGKVPRGGGGFAGSRGNFTIGTVTSVGTDSFKIAARSFGAGGTGATSTVTVKVTSSTIYRTGTGSAASSTSFSSVKKGVSVLVSGTKSGSTVSATSVVIVPAGSFGGRGFGGGGYGRYGGSAGGGAPAS